MKIVLDLFAVEPDGRFQAPDIDGQLTELHWVYIITCRGSLSLPDCVMNYLITSQTLIYNDAYFLVQYVQVGDDTLIIIRQPIQVQYAILDELDRVIYF